MELQSVMLGARAWCRGFHQMRAVEEQPAIRSALKWNCRVSLEFLETPPKGATTRDIEVAGCGVGGVR